MPTNRRRFTRQRSMPNMERSKWADFCIEFMELGPGGLDAFRGNIEAARDYWAEYGEAITNEHIAKHPGTRPGPWWFWTHGESRPIANPLPADEERRLREEHTWDGTLHTTILHGYRRGDAVRYDGYPGVGLPYNESMLSWQEPEAEYLDRKGLLTDAERETLGL